MANSTSEDRLELWRERWSKSRTSWHKTNVNKNLIKHFNLLKNGINEIKILFPLCGKSVDLVHFYNEGHIVIGVEGVQMAVEELFKNDAIQYEKTFCNDINGYIYKVKSTFFHYFLHKTV